MMRHKVPLNTRDAATTPLCTSSIGYGAGIGVGAVLVGVAARLALDPVFGNAVPFITLLPVVAIAVYFGGTRPGVLATVLAAIAGLWFFVPPRQSLVLQSRLVIGQLMVFLLSCGIIVAYGRAWRLVRAEARNERRRGTELEFLAANRTDILTERLAEVEMFAHSIAHDLRTPLRAILGIARILRQDHKAQLDEEGLDCVQRIEMAAARLEQLIEQVLQYDKIWRGDLPLVPLEIPKVIDQVIAAHPELQPPGVEIRIETPMPRVIGHEVALTQVVSNLLGNSVKFVSPGTPPSVRISAEKSNGHVVLRFDDNGIGIPVQERDRLFRPFNRLRGARGYEGTGLGLAIVMRAVQRMRGRVGIEAIQGGGSRFWVELEAAAGGET